MQPFVSIIIPCRNEERYIGRCLDSIVGNDYPKDSLEILVVDGMSEDMTPKIVAEYAKKYPFIRLLKNEKKITPVALNQGILQSKGEIIMRMDAHTMYEKDYISKCVRYLTTYNVDNVGGVLRIVPGADSIVAKSIAFVLSSPFGSGNSPVKVTSKTPRFTDTVAFGCYRREVFERIGLYNENLVRSQDMELNLRLRQQGGKILLAPDIKGSYFADATFRTFWSHNVKDGIWATYPLRFVRVFFPFRHFIPGAFILCFGILILFSFFLSFFRVLLFIVLGLYLVFSLWHSLQIALRERNPCYLLFVPVAFGIRHFGYGIGTLIGIGKIFTPR